MGRIAAWCALGLGGMLVLTWAIAHVAAGRAIRRAEARLAEVQWVAPPPRATAPHALPQPRDEVRRVLVESPVARPLAWATKASDTEVLKEQRATATGARRWLFEETWKPHVLFGAPADDVRGEIAARRPHLEQMESALDHPPTLVASAADAAGATMEGLLWTLLLDAAVSQHDGNGANAARRAAQAWRLERELEDRGWILASKLTTLRVLRKTDVGVGFLPELDAESHRARASQGLAGLASDLVRRASQGSAREVLEPWHVEPTLTRRFLLPLYRRKLATRARILVDESEGVGRRPLDRRLDGASVQELAAPALPLPTGVRELFLGMGLGDLTEPQWDRAALELGGMDYELMEVEITRVVILLRSQRDAAGNWPSQLPAVTRPPGARLELWPTEPGHLLLGLRRAADAEGNPVLIAPPLPP